MLQKIHLPNLNKSMADLPTNKKSSGNKKTKQSRKKPVPTPIPAPVNPSNSETQHAVLQVVRDAIRIQLAGSMQKRRQVEEEIDAMVGTCQEFMKSFIILGYDMEGKQVPPIISANTQQEADAIGNYLQKFLQHIVRNDGNIGTIE